MRTNAAIAAYTGQNASEILCPIIGGLSNKCMVPVLSQSRPKGTSLVRENITLRKDLISFVFLA